MQSLLLDAMAERVLIYDGAMGTQIQGANLSDADFILDPSKFTGRIQQAAQRLDGKLLDGCNEILVLTRPEVIESIHGAYFEAGSDMVETNSFGTTSIVLGEYEIPELVYELALESAKVARRAADRHTTVGKPRFVVGALGPGTKLISLGQATWEELEQTYAEGRSATAPLCSGNHGTNRNDATRQRNRCGIEHD
jgi:5-methyltetrahydrofolate--homocysteine methyltransferase